ncbi:MAG: YheC/YheD family protein [Actinomycetota bacterium]
MRIAFFVNDLETEDPRYTTTRLARAAVSRGHEVTYITNDDFSFEEGDRLSARARPAGTAGEDLEAFLNEAREAEAQHLDLETLDVLLLRSDPTQDLPENPWAPPLGAIFGQLLTRRGVLVLNDPTGLSRALNKLYFQAFPSKVRPDTLISRDVEAIKRFIADHEGAVIKPLQGSGGQGVFHVRADEGANVNQMIEAVMRDGYVVVQEFIPLAAEGDLRLFLMNGRPLQIGSAFAAFRRISESEDFRSNMSAGGRSIPADVDEGVLAIAGLVRPKLVEDGMFLVGLDIAGGKLLEVNVFSPGGLGSASEFGGVDFSDAVVAALEKKVGARTGQDLTNVELATL